MARSKKVHRSLVYRDKKTGRLVSESTWKRSKARGGTRYVRQRTKVQRARGTRLIGTSSRVKDPRVARALGLMRREGVSASDAARRERMKLKTFRQGAGRYLYRAGPGKPLKARTEDQLSFSMTIPTTGGPAEAIVRNSRERKLLHRYEFALRMFRAGEDGAEAALKEFEGKTVGGHKLITDIKILIELDEAGQLDFDAFYTSIGARP